MENLSKNSYKRRRISGDYSEFEVDLIFQVVNHILNKPNITNYSDKRNKSKRLFVLNEIARWTYILSLIDTDKFEPDIIREACDIDFRNLRETYYGRLGGSINVIKKNCPTTGSSIIKEVNITYQDNPQEPTTDADNLNKYKASAFQDQQGGVPENSEETTSPSLPSSTSFERSYSSDLDFLETVEGDRSELPIRHDCVGVFDQKAVFAKKGFQPEPSRSSRGRLLKPVLPQRTYPSTKGAGDISKSFANCWKSDDTRRERIQRPLLRTREVRVARRRLSNAPGKHPSDQSSTQTAVTKTADKMELPSTSKSEGKGNLYCHVFKHLRSVSNQTKPKRDELPEETESEPLDNLIASSDGPKPITKPGPKPTTKLGPNTENQPALKSTTAPVPNTTNQLTPKSIAKPGSNPKSKPALKSTTEPGRKTIRQLSLKSSTESGPKFISKPGPSTPCTFPEYSHEQTKNLAETLKIKLEALRQAQSDASKGNDTKNRADAWGGASEVELHSDAALKSKKQAIDIAETSRRKQRSKKTNWYYCDLSDLQPSPPPDPAGMMPANERIPKMSDFGKINNLSNVQNEDDENEAGDESQKKKNKKKKGKKKGKKKH